MECLVVPTVRPLTERQVEVLAFISGHPYCSRTDIERGLELDHGATRWTIEGLVNRELVQRFESWSGLYGGRIVYSYVFLGATPLGKSHD